MPKKQITVTIGTPHNGDFTAEYINSLMGMAFHAFTTKGIGVKLHLHEGCLVHQGRNNIASKCYDDYLLFIDSDMAFPVDGLNKLIASKKDIIGAVYYSRKSPNLPLVFKENEGKYVNYEDFPEDKVFECDAIGTGFMLISKKVLEAFDKAINEKRFRLPFDFMHTEHHVELGEDMAFCNRAKQLGFKIYADPTIQMGHVGKDVITRNNYLAWK